MVCFLRKKRGRKTSCCKVFAPVRFDWMKILLSRRDAQRDDSHKVHHLLSWFRWFEWATPSRWVVARAIHFSTQKIREGNIKITFGNWKILNDYQFGRSAATIWSARFSFCWSTDGRMWVCPRVRLCPSLAQERPARRRRRKARRRKEGGTSSHQVCCAVSIFQGKNQEIGPERLSIKQIYTRVLALSLFASSFIHLLYSSLLPPLCRLSSSLTRCHFTYRNIQLEFPVHDLLLHKCATLKLTSFQRSFDPVMSIDSTISSSSCGFRDNTSTFQKSSKEYHGWFLNCHLAK